MRCIVICSGKGGTGKSCVAAYTGVALANAGKRTLLVELGKNARALEIILGVKNTVFGTLDVFAGRCDPSEAIVRAENFPGLMLMPAGEGPQVSSKAKVRALMRRFSEYDYVIVDNADISGFPMEFCDVCVIVTTPDTLSVQANAQAVRQLYAAGAPGARLIINNVPARIIPIGGVQDFDDIIDIVGAQLLAVIPTSPKLAFCSNNELPLDPDSLTVKIFENLAGRLMGERRPLLVR